MRWEDMSPQERRDDKKRCMLLRAEAKAKAADETVDNMILRYYHMYDYDLQQPHLVIKKESQ